MNLSELKETLGRLKNTRMLSIEAQAALDPYRDQTLHLRVSFRSASQTHSTQLGSEYNGGYTVVGSIDGGDLGISVLLRPSENENVEALSEGQILEMPLGVLDYDALYQRAIFGQLAAEQASILHPNPTLEPTLEPTLQPTPEPEPESSDSYWVTEPAPEPTAEPESSDVDWTPDSDPEPIPEPAAITPVPMEAPPELPLEPDPVMVDRIEQLQKQFRDAGVGHIHVSSAMAYSAKEAADPALTPVPMEVPSELTPELPLDRASHVIERVDKLQQQFRDASSSLPEGGPKKVHSWIIYLYFGRISCHLLRRSSIVVSPV